MTGVSAAPEIGPAAWHVTDESLLMREGPDAGERAGG